MSHRFLSFAAFVRADALTRDGAAGSRHAGPADGRAGQHLLRADGGDAQRGFRDVRAQARGIVEADTRRRVEARGARGEAGEDAVRGR